VGFNKKIERLKTLNQNDGLLDYNYAVGRGSNLFLIKDEDVFVINLENILKDNF
jgi:hypothetical protein